MTSIICEKYVLNCSNYGDSLKGASEQSASTISDCYSSDDDYKEALDGTQSENKRNLNVEKQNLPSEQLFHKGDDSYHHKQSSNHKLSQSVPGILDEGHSMGTRSPEFPLEKCMSEFYRPPSRSKNSLVGRRKHIGENASISSHHYIEPSVETSSEYLNSKMFHTDNLSTMKDIGNLNDLSASLFMCSNQFQHCNSGSYDDSTVKLISSKSLNSRTHLESPNHVYNLQNSNSGVFLDCEYNPLSRSEIENFTHSVSYRIPKLKAKMKTMTTQSTNELNEQTTQTSSKLIYKEKCIGTIEVNNMNGKNVNCEKGDNGDLMVNLCLPEYKEVEDRDLLSRNLRNLLQLLQKHINTITSNLRRYEANQIPANFDAKEDTFETIETNATPPSTNLYPNTLVVDLYQQIRLMTLQLEMKLKHGTSDRRTNRHQRRYSDVMSNRDLLLDNRDFLHDRPPDNGFSENRVVNLSAKTVPTAPLTHNEMDIGHISESHDWACRVFEVNPYDDLIKSYKSTTDRRIKALGNKMKCKITIEGPFRLYNSNNACWNMRNKTGFRCSLYGNSKDIVDKCVKCLQDTFPQSCLNERHIALRSINKQLFS